MFSDQARNRTGVRRNYLTTSTFTAIFKQKITTMSIFLINCYVMAISLSKYIEGAPKRSSQGYRKKSKRSSMNKAKKRQFKAYRGQGR